MTIEDIKRLDKRIRKIQYPFGENFQVFHEIFMETARQQNLSLSDTVQQYVGWKYHKD